MNLKFYKPEFKNEFFVFLLPLFFVVHEFVYHYPIIPVAVPLRLLIEYLALIILLLVVASFYFKNFQRSALFVFCIMSIYFFFGAIHDGIKMLLGEILLSKYILLIPFILLLLILLAYFLRRTSKSFSTAVKYLNLLLILLIGIDIVTLIIKAPKEQVLSVKDVSTELKKCDTCTKPDIYLIIADEYAGKQELEEAFGFDNSLFLNELKNRGFHIVDKSISNYNATVYSMASMFNMNYLQNFKKNRITLKGMFRSRELIKENAFIEYIKSHGYTIHNFSFFDLDDKPHAVTNFFFPTHRKLFTSQTFINRVANDIGANFVDEKWLEKTKKNNLYNDKKIDSLTRETSITKTATPKFVYSHLAMPHHPYYFDSLGKEATYSMLTDEFNSDKQAYIQYLIYTNKKLLQLVDHIRTNSAQPPVIIIMSDHGWRQFNEDVDKKYYFMNLNAVLLPDRNYSQYYDGMSNINQIRALLNSQFQQKLTMLPDSTIFLVE